MDEEAGFIAALAAEPDDRTTLLVFADWLDERADPRAEGKLLLAAPKPDWKRIAELSSPSRNCRAWVMRYKCGCGSVVRLTGGPFEGHVGQVVGLFPNDGKFLIAVRVLFLGGIIDYEVDSSLVEHA
jgi:uncharacterized protein (TIGR02996 family)